MTCFFSKNDGFVENYSKKYHKEGAFTSKAVNLRKRVFAIFKSLPMFAMK